MTVLSYNEIAILVKTNVVTGSGLEFINAASLDLTLGNTILVEKESTSQYTRRVVSLNNRDPLDTVTVDIEGGGFILEPGAFILAQTEQMFYLPDNISAEYKLKSSMARVGLEHLNAGWCDAGWNGSVLTLELKNMTRHHAILLKPGDRIGQMIFYKHPPVPPHASYKNKGAYNDHAKVTGAQPAKGLKPNDIFPFDKDGIV